MNLVIVGCGEFAEIVYEYLHMKGDESPVQVVAFSAEEKYIDKKEMCGVPVVPLEGLEKSHPQDSHRVFVAISYSQLNRLRTRLYEGLRKKGYGLLRFISRNAFVWDINKIGQHCFIFENNVIQPFVRIGDNVILWSGNHIGHHSTIKDNCYISSHVVISGACEIGENSFLGVNCTIHDRVKIARDCIIGAGAVVLKDTEPEGIYVGNPARRLDKSSLEVFG